MLKEAAYILGSLFLLISHGKNMTQTLKTDANKK